MAMSIAAISTPPVLATRPLRQERSGAAASVPQRPDLAAQGNERRQPLERFAPQPLPGPVRTPSIRVEYQQDRPILMLHDQRGVLIYQIPSKGALLLIRQEETPSLGLSERV